MGEEDFRALLRDRLGVRLGTVVMVHNSMDLLNLGFGPARALQLLQEAVGPQGTLAFPTFPARSSYEVLKQGTIFDVRRTPCGSGLLGELARRQPNARRSLHPTRSVVALGPLAEALVANHHESPLVCGEGSPFRRIVEMQGQVIGLGISSKNLTLVHAVDDHPANPIGLWPYHPSTFLAPCIDETGRRQSVRTYAHNAARMAIDIPDFLAQHVDRSIAEDFAVGPMHFFRVAAAPLMHRMLELAQRGITIYS